MPKFKFEFSQTSRGHGVITAENEEEARGILECSDLEPYTDRSDFDLEIIK